MSLVSDKCVEYNENRKICVASENGKTYRLNNNSDYIVKKVKVDKCIQQRVGEHRCDYLMHVTKGKELKAIFIELKGGALTDAAKQLYDTIVYFKGEFKGCQLHARIVGTKDAPNIVNTPQYKKLFREVSSTNGTIERATNKVLIENI